MTTLLNAILDRFPTSVSTLMILLLAFLGVAIVPLALVNLITGISSGSQIVWNTMFGTCLAVFGLVATLFFTAITNYALWGIERNPAHHTKPGDKYRAWIQEMRQFLQTQSQHHGDFC